MPKFYMQNTNGRVIVTDYPQYHADAKRLPKAEGERLYREQFRADVLTYLKPGATVYTCLRHVSGSGMSRRISVHIVRDGELCDITYPVSVVTGYKISDKGGIVMSGCGQDMGFALVYALGCALWPKGTPEPHGTRNGEPDSDGGYALRQTWM